MKLKFKKQAYQTLAVGAVVDCFKGQLNASGINYRIEPGNQQDINLEYTGFKNADFLLNKTQLICLANLENLNAHFIQQDLPQAERLKLLNNTAIQQIRLLTEDKTVKQLSGDK